jgi:hypothetical protein
MPLAMKLSNCDLGVASEGSLVLTLLYLLQVQMMFLIFIDKKQLGNNSPRTSMETNFNGSEITNEQELLDFAELVSSLPRINPPSIKNQKWYCN